MASLLVSAAIEVPRTEYTKLVKESEQNDVIRRLLQKNKYISTEDLKTILRVEDEAAPNEVIAFEELLGEKEGEKE